MNTYYFLKDQDLPGKRADIEGLSHSLVPIRSLKKLDTICIDLTKTEDELYQNLHRTNRQQIKKATRSNLSIEILDHPTMRDIKAFQKFYNHFVKQKDTYGCNAFHVNTMKQLKEKHALFITRILDDSKKILCYRVYISDGNTVFSLYSASTYAKETADYKRLLSVANRYLLWNNILYFKQKGHSVYDMGGLTTNENIRKFKLEFGGGIKQVYSGYEANSKIGQLVLWLRAKKMKEG